MILEFLRDGHRKCDAAFAEAESAAAATNLAATKTAFELFKKETLHHFAMEEEVLFPMFEQYTGMKEGPTQMMRTEHDQVRWFLKRMHTALEQDDTATFLGLAESMMILLQQHNMKEEQMLYPACDYKLQGDAALAVKRMKGLSWT